MDHQRSTKTIVAVADVSAPDRRGASKPQASSVRSRVQRRLVVSGLIVFLPVVLLAGAWRLGGVSAIGDDLIYYFPIRQYIGQQIRQGIFPLWNPLTAMGTSVAADPQSGLWYLPTYLFVLLPALWAYPASIVIHFAWAGGGMYRLLRSWRHDWRAALLGALAFEFSAYMVSHRSHLTIHHAVAWIPWILLGWSRFTQTGRYRYFALATVAFGLQMLVQHVQISLMTCTLLAAYAAFILWPRRRSLWWELPVGMALGAAISAVQLVPTWFHYAASTRGTPAYHIFVENSWVPTSAFMFLFPMFYGTGTPNFWNQSWWGISHFCEQWPYATILVLLLVLASVVWVGRNREVTFWWIACFVAMIVALGGLTPLSKLLYHLPVYRNLRVPARWILVWSVALPVLASTVLSVLLKRGQDIERLSRCVKSIVRRVLPVLIGACLLVMVVARWQLGWLQRTYGHRWDADRVLDGLKEAIRLENPAIWVSLILTSITGWLLVRWTVTHERRLFHALFGVFLLDLAMVVAFVDVDPSVYTRRDLVEPPPLAQAIRKLEPRPGDRLLVPRYHASYQRPLELLFPQSNMQHGIAAFSGYGPFWPTANRMLFRFMPWGSSESIIDLLRNRPLLQAMGVRFVAVRSSEEREVFQAGAMPSVPNHEPQRVQGSDRMTPVPSGEGVFWPVRIDAPGLYELAFDADPVEGASSRWFVRLENAQQEAIGRTHTVDPIDLALGARRLRFLFVCDSLVGRAFVRLKSEMGQAVSAGRATLGRIAEPLGDDELSRSPFVHRADLPGGITLYELEATADLVYPARGIVPVPDLLTAIEKGVWRGGTDDSRGSCFSAGVPRAIVEWPDNSRTLPPSGQGTLEFDRPAGHELRVEVDSLEGMFLVFNESYDPGWNACVDGQRTEIHRVNAVCQGVAVPPGSHAVRFTYRPRGLVVGACVSVLALLIVLMGFIATSRRRRA